MVVTSKVDGRAGEARLLALQVEVERLRTEVAWLRRQLAVVQVGGSVVGQDVDLYVFDEGDESGAAFDEFFAAPDPHLEKVRGFLLD